MIRAKLLQIILSSYFLWSCPSLLLIKFSKILLITVSCILSFRIFVVLLLIATDLSSLIDNWCMTRLGSFSQVDLQESVLWDDSFVAAHLTTVGPAASLSSFTTCSTREKSWLIVLAQGIDLVVAWNTVKFTDSGWGASIFGKALIACLVVSEVVDLDKAQEKDWRAKEQSYHNCGNNYDIAEPVDITTDAQFV